MEFVFAAVCTGPCTHSGGVQLGRDLCPFHINHPPRHGSSFVSFFSGLASVLYCNLVCCGCEIGVCRQICFTSSSHISHISSSVSCEIFTLSVFSFPSSLVVSFMLSMFHFVPFAFLLYLIKPICFPLSIYLSQISCARGFYHNNYE